MKHDDIAPTLSEMSDTTTPVSSMGSATSQSDKDDAASTSSGSSAGPRIVANHTHSAVDQWHLSEQIGSGAFATVQKAKHSESGEIVAIKLVNKRKLVDEEEHDMIRREMDVMRSVQHFNILRCHDTLESNAGYYLVLEYALCGDIFDVLNDRALDEADARRIFRQTVDAVDHLHHLNIAHRDVKPENVMLDCDGNVKLGDFGMSVYFDDGERLKERCSTSFYMAPQVVLGQSYDPKALDIWSLGVLLYCLLARKRPFDHPSQTILEEKIAKGAFSIPSSVSPLAADLLKRMLVVNEADRATMAEIKAHPWLHEEDNAANSSTSSLDSYVEQVARRKSASAPTAVPVQKSQPAASPYTSSPHAVRASRPATVASPHSYARRGSPVSYGRAPMHHYSSMRYR